MRYLLSRCINFRFIEEIIFFSKAYFKQSQNRNRPCKPMLVPAS